MNASPDTSEQKPFTQAQLVKYLEKRRIDTGHLPGKVYALRPSDPVRPGHGVTVVYEVNNVLLGESVWIADGVNWKSRRPTGIL